jgi:hypothetical protein
VDESLSRISANELGSYLVAGFEAVIALREQAFNVRLEARDEASVMGQFVAHGDTDEIAPFQQNKPQIPARSSVCNVVADHRRAA